MEYFYFAYFVFVLDNPKPRYVDFLFFFEKKPLELMENAYVDR